MIFFRYLCSNVKSIFYKSPVFLNYFICLYELIHTYREARHEMQNTLTHCVRLIITIHIFHWRCKNTEQETLLDKFLDGNSYISTLLCILFDSYIKESRTRDRRYTLWLGQVHIICNLIPGASETRSQDSGDIVLYHHADMLASSQPNLL